LPRARTALGKAFAEGQDGPRQRKAAVTVPALLAVSLPRASPRQINVFFKKNFAESFHGPSAKIFFIFLKTFAVGLIFGPRQRNF
jgi:hypothetical protein